MAQKCGKQSESDVEKMRNQISGYFSSHLNKDTIAFVAKDGEEIISVVVLIIHERPANPTCIKGKIGEVMSVYTKPEHRRKGYALKLVTMLTEYALLHQIDRVDLLATKMGYPVYLKAGFTETKSDYVSMRFNQK